jgi:putative ABC transport system permease protein
MSTAVRERPAHVRSDNGGVPARRAVIRWAWRLFRREWRQQLLVLALIVVAVAATFVGAAVATDTPPPAGAGFGTAKDLANFPGSDRHLAADIASLQQRFGRVDVIENQILPIPGSVDTYELRAQNPHGAFGQPMLALTSGHYPTGPGQVAVTDGVASAFNLRVGDVWHQGGVARRVTGIVENPQSLLDEFALVAPGQVSSPSQVTVLFDAGRASPNSLGSNVETLQQASNNNSLNPETIVLGLATVGMLLIALVGIGGFTVLAQRRLRSLGMLGAQGASDKNIRLVMRANGVLVGVVGAVVGAVLGFLAWLAYRPSVESSAHHLIGTFQLPWVVIGPAMGLAVLATYFAASRPARSVTRVPIVTALSGRPAPPKQVHRSAIPGVVLLIVAGFLLSYSGSTDGNGNGALALVAGLVLIIVAVILLAPLCLSLLGRLSGRAPIAVRLALRDLARYRARSGSALAAISLGVLIGVLVAILAAQRYANVLDYAGPNLASNQVIVYDAGAQNPTAAQMRSMAASARNIAAGLGSHELITLDSPGATLQHAAAGRQFSGAVYVATPQLLAAFGINASQVDPAADVLTMRPGLSGLSDMQLVYGNYFGSNGNGPPGSSARNPYPCPKTNCLANPVIQEAGALPSGTSAPNTVVTEGAIHRLGLRVSTADGWLIVAPHDPTAAQITNARLAADGAGMSIETKNSSPSSSEIINWATVFGIALALGILAMSVGLIRSEAARDLRTLAATGAGSSTRRTLTAATAGGLALLGAVLGTAAAYVGALAYSWDNKLDGLSSLTSVPVTNLLIILVGMPLAAAVIGWLLAGREPSAIAHQPIE